MRAIASFDLLLSVDAIFTVPSSSISITQPVSSVSARIVAPPLPMMSRILSVGTFIVVMRGANSETSSRAPAIASSITLKMCKRAAFAWFSAISMMFLVIPSILISICSAVIPSVEPATLKSMSPR